MVNKDLGMVTAYAYAVSKGYTGTEDEFAALMADYADVGERAEAAAEAAAASATAASGSASDSAASATAAEGFAGNASTAAGNASQAAQNASQSATAASGSATSAAGSATAAAGSATTAENKATEAAQSATEAAGSATTAGTAATNAQTAQTAAETAQTAAEDAQAAAEDAAESVEGKAAQIDQNTEDISLLKSHLNATEIVDTASGAIASFADGSDGIPVESLTVSMEPIQNLNGQANPYPGGGGKNQWITKAYKNLGYNVAVGTEVNLEESDAVTTFSGNTITYAVEAWGGRVFKTNPLTAGQYHIHFDATTVTNARVTLYRIGSDNVIKAAQPSTTSVVYDYSYTVDDGDYITIYIASNTAQTITVKDYQIESGNAFTTWSPYSNICPISGRQSVTVTRSGVNIWDEQWEVGTINASDGSDGTGRNAIRAKNYCPCLPNTSYYGHINGTLYIFWYDAEKGFISFNQMSDSVQTSPVNAHYFRIQATPVYGTTYNHDISINYPSTDTAYHPHTIQTVTVQLGQTVYGGSLDVTNGVLTVDWVGVDMGDLNYSKSTSGLFLSDTLTSVIKKPTVSAIPTGKIRSSMYTEIASLHITGPDGPTPSPDGVMAVNTQGRLYFNNLSYTERAAFKAAMSGVQLVYELATPQTIQLSPQTINSLLGQNNLWSDAGDVAVDYVADTKLYIQKAIAAAVANV